MPVICDGVICDGAGGGSGLIPTPIIPDNVLVGNAGATGFDYLPLASLVEGIKYAWPNAAARIAQTGMTADELGVQRDTGDVYKYDGATWSVFFNLQDGASPSGITTYRAAVTTSISVFSATYIPIPPQPAFSISPPAGDYAVWFSSNVIQTAGAGLSEVHYGIGINGALVASTERRNRALTSTEQDIGIADRITVPAGGLVQVLAKCVGAVVPTVEFDARTLVMLQV